MTEAQALRKFTDKRNAEKVLFTAGPASLLPENLEGLQPCFGRGDAAYTQLEARVLDGLRAMTGHAHIARMQGSASLALEIMSLNFLRGRVLVVDTGYYSERMETLARMAKASLGHIGEVQTVHWRRLEQVDGAFDWIVACYTETSCGLKVPVERLKACARRAKARLMLDATASIGLETGHELADVIAYSSCKGLFGLTGAAFVAFHDVARLEVPSFYLSLDTHLDKRVTGPYHAIASLDGVLNRHVEFRSAVAANKTVFTERFQRFIALPDELQPLLCTYVNCPITASDNRVVLYSPRSTLLGSVVCHLGEVHLGKAARGDIIGLLN